MVKRRKSLLDAFRATGPSMGAAPPGAKPPAAKLPGLFPPTGTTRPPAQVAAPAAQLLAALDSEAASVTTEPVRIELSAVARAAVPVGNPSNSVASASATVAPSKAGFAAGSTPPPRSYAAALEPTLSKPSSRDRVMILLVCSALLLVAVAWWARANKGASTGTLAAGDGAERAEASARSVSGAAPAALDADSTVKSPGASSTVAEQAARIQAPAYGYTSHDQAFLDKRYRFTLRLVQYNNDETGVGLAKATYQYLLDEGLPVVQPIETGNKKHILLCAGYAAKQDELAGMRKHVAALRGQKPEPKKPPFEGAYVVNIDDVITRP